LINQILEELAIHPNLWLGQLLVVELCNNLRQPELIPGPAIKETR